MTNNNERRLFENAIQALEAEVANIGAHLIIDSSARQSYSKKIKAMANELRVQASSGRISWTDAANTANETRNTIMEITRQKSTPVGKALAHSIKQQGITLNEIIAKKVIKLHGPKMSFHDLTQQQQNAIYSEVVTSAGKSNPTINTTLKKVSYAGRSLIFLSVALSVYTVATADNKLEAAGKEVALTGTSIAGGIAGGAVAGLACGPGAPVCVTVGAFIGGALAAFGIGFAW